MKIDLPENQEIEGMLIGAILTNPHAAEVILHECQIEDFFHAKNICMFNSLKQMCLDKIAFDTFLVIKYLKDQGSIEQVGGIAGVMSYYSRCYSGFPYEDYIAELRALTRQRRLLFLCRDSLAELTKPNSADVVISRLQDGISLIQGIEITKAKKLIETNPTFEEDLEWRIMRHNEDLPTYSGVLTNYSKLDYTIGSFSPSCIYLIGARTSMGKTTFLLNLMRGIKNTPIGFFSLEMPAKIIMEKFIAMEADVRYPWVQDGDLNPDQLYRIHCASKKVEELPIFIEDPHSITIKALCYRARRMKLQHNIKILFIDYLTRISVEDQKKSKHLQVDEISKSLQSLAKELDIPIVVLAQLNRQNTKRADPRPCVSDFRESGSIEEDADVCILLHRPEYYKPGEKQGLIEVMVEKNRLRGMVKTIPFVCRSAFSERYREASEIEIEEWETEKQRQDEENKQNKKRKWGQQQQDD